MHPISIIVMTRVVETVRSVVLNPIALVWRDPVIRLGTIGAVVPATLLHGRSMAGSCRRFDGIGASARLDDSFCRAGSVLIVPHA